MSAYQGVNVLGTRIIHELLGAIWAFSPLLLSTTLFVCKNTTIYWIHNKMYVF